MTEGREERRRRGGQGRRRGRGGGRGEKADRIRAFLAFEIPESVRNVLAGEVDRLRRSLPPARWIGPENLHLTVKFLGQVERPRLDKLNLGLVERLEELSPVEFQLGGAGFFPSPSQARVVWVGGRAKGIEAVVQEVESVAAMQGFRQERDEWRIHLTIARLDRPWPRYAAEELISWGEDLSLPRFTGAQLVCFESRLLRTGSVYTPLKRIPLGGRENGA